MAVFRPNFASVTTSILQQRQTFGIEDAHNEFVTPVAHFKFFDAKGDAITTYGEVYIRMNNSFLSGLSNQHQETEGIFGQPFEEGIVSGLGTFLGSGLEALSKQLLAGAQASAGAIASAGQTGRAQIEFLSRQMLNNFQQLIYRGPGFRRFNLTFTMRPTSYAEAESMRNIISIFRIASSPKGGEGSGSEKFSDTIPRETSDDEGTVSTVNDGGLDTSKLGDAKFLFGYPDMCTFDLQLYKGGVDQELTTLWSSKLCVIENVNATYGSQNKMTFFDDKNSGQYFPTDVNFEIQLKEAVLITESDAINDLNNFTVV